PVRGSRARQSRELNLEPGCETPLVWRHIAVDGTAQGGPLRLQGAAVAIDCAEDGDPGQRKPAADHTTRTHRSGLRGREFLGVGKWPLTEAAFSISADILNDGLLSIGNKGGVTIATRWDRHLSEGCTSCKPGGNRILRHRPLPG